MFFFCFVCLLLFVLFVCCVCFVCFVLFVLFGLDWVFVWFVGFSDDCLVHLLVGLAEYVWIMRFYFVGWLVCWFSLLVSFVGFVCWLFGLLFDRYFCLFVRLVGWFLCNQFV